jgi:hypothetical protein
MRPARIIKQASKLDNLRVLQAAGVAPTSYAPLKRRLPAYAEEAWRPTSPQANVE